MSWLKPLTSDLPVTSALLICQLILHTCLVLYINPPPQLSSLISKRHTYILASALSLSHTHTPIESCSCVVIPAQVFQHKLSCAAFSPATATLTWFRPVLSGSGGRGGETDPQVLTLRTDSKSS